MDGGQKGNQLEIGGTLNVLFAEENQNHSQGIISRLGARMMVAIK